MKRYVVLLVSLLLTAGMLTALVTSRQAAAQSGTRVPSGTGVQSGARAQSGRAVTQTTFESRLWNYLHQVSYRNWAPAPGQDGDFYAGQSPHGAYLKMYLNRTAVANAASLPARSMIIKENYGPDRKTLMAVTVMYRSEGYDPAHRDWYWVKYNPDGSVAKTPPEKGSVLLRGRVQGCINCHADAGGEDFAFFND